MVGFFFFFQAEDGIRDIGVTGVQTCALPISTVEPAISLHSRRLKSVGASPAVPSCCHCTPKVNLVCLEALPAHVGKEAAYGRRVYPGLALQRDLLVDWLKKGFDRQ